MSKPRPIHTHRALNSAPDEAEPSYSYERESYLGGKEVEVEDEFHRRLAGSRRENAYSSSGGSGSSFWRTSTVSSTGEGSQGPSYQSATFKGHNDNAKRRNGSGAIGEMLQPFTDSEHSNGSRDSVSFKMPCCCMCLMMLILSSHV